MRRATSASLDFLTDKKVLILASTGGHLEQAFRWSRILNLDKSSVFVTFDNAQSRALLEDDPHVFVPYVPPRGFRQIIQAFVATVTRPSLRQSDVILSTGAGLALIGPLLAIVLRKPFVYVESVSRFEGPSLTGRILRWVPFVRTYCQHAGYPRGWKLVPSLLDQYRCVEGEGVKRDALRMFVTLGTIRPFEFARMVNYILPIIRDQDTVIWQLGATRVAGLPGDVRGEMTGQEFIDEASKADVVFTHGGVGTILSLLAMGKRPWVCARISSLGEHVDDHQKQVVNVLSERGLLCPITQNLTRAEVLSETGTRIVIDAGQVR